jgi:tetratricopeptide (TPR) repeat protein
MKRVALAFIVLMLFSLGALADEGHHHEDLTTDQLGTVHFPVSCAAAVQKPFERGVALLHSFWYEEAEKEFEQIAKDDPQCAMAHWGIAMSIWHQLWNRPDAATVKRGQAEVKNAKSLHPKTGREHDYIAAMDTFYRGKKRDYHDRSSAYSKAMETAYQRYPDDREAAAFYALSLLASEPDSDTTFANRKQAAAVLEKLFAVEPDHPGVAHYLIHSYTSRSWLNLGCPPHDATRRLLPPLPMRCICRRTSSPASVCGRTISIPTSPP